MAKQYQRITLNFFLDTDSEINLDEMIKIFKHSSDYQHDNLSIYPDGELAIMSDIYAMDFRDPAHSRIVVKALFEAILERI